MKAIIASLSIVFLLISSTFVQATDIREIYLVRHAEKQSDGTSNPALTKAGKQRAENLAKQLEKMNITTIYSTNYKRTMETAMPLAVVLGIEIKQYNPRALADFAKQLMTEKDNVLVVGHSNTTPELTVLLGGDAYGGMDESVYDRLYLLQLSDGKVTTTLLKTTSSSASQ